VNKGQIDSAKQKVTSLGFCWYLPSCHCQVASCHGCRLGFNRTGNSAIRSTGYGLRRKPYPRTNMKWIG